MFQNAFAGDANLVQGIYRIQSLRGCPHDPLCNGQLAWDRTEPHPTAEIRHCVPVEWEIIPYNTDLYVIRSRWGCPTSPHCNALLSRDGWTGGNATVSIQQGDTVLWRIWQRENGYVITSDWGCSNVQSCYGELSWKRGGADEGRAIIASNDPVNWAITRLDGGY